MNKAILMGRLTRDPEVRYSQNNLPITNFTIAIDRRFTRQGEERQADFIPIVSFGKTAEFCEKYYRKGQRVLVVGRIQTRTWDDNEGKRRYVTEVICEEAYFADSRQQDGGGGRQDDYGYIPQGQQDAPQGAYGVGQPGSPYGMGARAFSDPGAATRTFGSSGGGSGTGVNSSGANAGTGAGSGFGGVGNGQQPDAYTGQGASNPGVGVIPFSAGADRSSTATAADSPSDTQAAAPAGDDDGFMPIENESDLPF